MILRAGHVDLISRNARASGFTWKNTAKKTGGWCPMAIALNDQQEECRLLLRKSSVLSRSERRHCLNQVPLACRPVADESMKSTVPMRPRKKCFD